MKSYKNISRRKFISAASLAVPIIILPDLTFPSMDNPGKYIKKGGMRFGLDMGEYGNYEGKHKPPIEALDFAKEHGFDGVAFRSMLELSPTLDTGQLNEIKAHADSLGLYLESGVGWVNPYNTSERSGAVEARRFGNGDYKLAIEKMIIAAAKIGCKELYAVSGNTGHGTPSFIAQPRYRTDVTWRDQLLAMKKFITMLKPVLKDVGCRLDLETHGDETSFELLELIHELGEDIFGVTLDTGNLPLSADVPMDAIKRLAPYVHMVQPRDGILYKTKEGIVQQLRPLGQGVIDWKEALVTFGKYSPNLHFNIECFFVETLFRFYDPEWRKNFPDLTDKAITEFEQLTKASEDKIKNGEIMGIEKFNKNHTNCSREEAAEYLRGIYKTSGLN